MVAGWLQTGSIAPNPAIPVLARTYPGFHEALIAWIALPFGHEHLSVLVGQWQLVTFGLTIAALLARLGVAAGLACAIVAYVLSAPQSALATRGTDLLFGTALLGVWLGLVFWWDACRANDRRAARGWAMALGACAGMLVATKYSGVGYAGAAGAAGIAGCLIDRYRRGALSRSTTASIAEMVIVAGLCAAVVAGPWYVRNTLLYGNPLYPAQMLLPGGLALAGPATSAWLRSDALGMDIAPLVRQWRHFIQAFGLLFPLQVVLAFGGAILALTRRGRGDGETWHILAMIALIPICFVLFLVQPFTKPSFDFNYNMRFLVGWFGLCAIAAGWTCQRLFPRADRGARTAVHGRRHRQPAAVDALVVPRVRSDGSLRPCDFPAAATRAHRDGQALHAAGAVDDEGRRAGSYRQRADRLPRRCLAAPYAPTGLAGPRLSRRAQQPRVGRDGPARSRKHRQREDRGDRRQPFLSALRRSLEQPAVLRAGGVSLVGAVTERGRGRGRGASREAGLCRVLQPDQRTDVRWRVRV